MDGVLDALKHIYLLTSEKGGDDLNSANFYLTMFLYKNTSLNVKKKMEEFIKKTKSYDDVKLFFIM